MFETAHFRVDTRLAALLGETYRSTELALKELVDNAWDADAEHVYIILPEPLTTDPIVIRDDGIGMTEAELRTGFLKVASDRRLRNKSGELTPRLGRQVKGRKGIGKFAGLAAANVMVLETRSRGYKTEITIRKDELLQKRTDLEKVMLPLIPGEAPTGDHGTTVTLSELNQNLSFPDPGRLKRLLYLEYGRQSHFHIFVNGEALDVEDLPGEVFTGEADLPEVGKVSFRFLLSEKQVPGAPGLSLRVKGKIVGSPQLFGLDQSTDIPRHILRAVHGELVADGLEGDVTIDWGDIVENSIAWGRIKSFVQPQLHKVLSEREAQEAEQRRLRYQRDMNKALRRLPEGRREQAQEMMDKILGKYAEGKEEYVRTLIDVIVDVMRMND